VGGFFGVASKQDCMLDTFFGTDYHSHLGTYAGGMAAWDKEIGLQRRIHGIKNAPFRTKFETIFDEMKGTSAIGCISDTFPEPLLIRSKLGAFAICTVGVINNASDLTKICLNDSNTTFDAMTGGKVNDNELVAALINLEGDFTSGVKRAQELVDGTLNLLILTNTGSLIVARDKAGRLPVHVGKNEDGFAVSSEPFAFQKLGFEDFYELGPGEIVEVTADGLEQLAAPGNKKHICAFLWSYYGYPTSSYEGVNVEVMRYRNGRIMAQTDAERHPDMHIDYVGGVPDSGTPHAIGYANESGTPFARAFIKYSPTWQRSFMPQTQADRDKVAKMKQIAVPDLIKDKDLLFVDDSIVRGTQLQGTVQFLFDNGAKSVHMRSACPPIMFSCKYLNFSRETTDMELIARRVINELEGEEGEKYLEEYSDGSTERGRALRKAICEKLHFDSLEFQSLEGVIEAIGLPECDLCTYCWTGRE